MQHLMGFLKNDLGREDKAELLGIIGDHQQGPVPLIDGSYPMPRPARVE
jgi:uncharacterized protein YbgA (DUF1722 family)